MKNRVQLELFLTVLAIVAAVGLVSFQNDTARMESWEARQRAQGIQRGAALYAANCRSCHGVNGEGVGDLGPAFNDAHFFTGRLDEVYWPGTLEEYVANVIAAGRVVPTRDFYAGDGQVAMTAWAQVYGGPLRPDEITDLTAFVLNWQATALGEVQLTPLQITATPAALGDAQQGQQIFLAAGCASCHRIAGINEIAEAAGPDLTNIATTAATRQANLSAEGYLRESFFIPNAFIVAGYGENSGCGGVLSYAQLEHLIAFLLAQE
jgi:mono/diheme cytochrome c family protein